MSNEKKAMSVNMRLIVVFLLLCCLCWNVTPQATAQQNRGSQEAGGGAVEIVDTQNCCAPVSVTFS